MNFLIVWIIQLFVFFLIVSSVASLFVKSTKANAKSQHERLAGDDVEAEKRNAPKKSKKNNRPIREQRAKREQYQRYDRKKPEQNMIQGVVTLSSSKKTKKKNTSVTFNKQNLKQAIVYKEILDKPIALRDED
ncbi:MAG: hypothetical protein JJU16_12500 [Alkalibacterium sp.]|nr:hypothetical protein [Alkalibacterium sp.]